jgi:HD-GYP domain-containing protein (c-di-GMP phosphodiesterase class II)
MRNHSRIGASIVGSIPRLEEVRELILYHHEHYDGTGYPRGLKGESIPIGARLLAVADAFDTMTTNRAYRAAISMDSAIEELRRCSGTQLCPVVVAAFISGFMEHRGYLEPAVLLKTKY